jgi:hypothetical protein
MKKLSILAVALVICLAGAPADARPAPAHRDHERFTVVFAGPPGAPGFVVATGRQNAIGTITPNDNDESGLDTFVFPQGTLTVHSNTSTTVRPSSPPSCITRFASSGTLEIVEGTGAFTGWSGYGTVTDHGFARSHTTTDGCAEEPDMIHSLLRADTALT